MERLGRTDFGVLVERFRSPWVVPFGVPGVEQLWNTLEFFVHHEDIRRAQPGWTRRSLPESDEQTLWSYLKVTGRGLARPAGVPLRMEWEDATATLRGGDDPVVLRGAAVGDRAGAPGPGAGRRRWSTTGRADAVERVRGADLGAVR